MPLIKLFTSTAKTPYLAWRLFSIVLMGAMSASVIASVFFIYDSVYQTLGDANSIVALNSNVNLTTINQTVYTKARELVALKNTTNTIDKINRNIFIPVITPSSTTR